MIDTGLLDGVQEPDSTIPIFGTKGLSFVKLQNGMEYELQGPTLALKIA